MKMRQLVIEVPEEVFQAAKTDEVAFARELKMLAAIKLFELRRISSSAAAELAGLTREGFLLGLVKYTSFPVEAELIDED